MLKTMTKSSDSCRTHVISRDGRWAVKKQGATRATKVYFNKHSAITGAVRGAKKGSDVIVHRRDGTVERWITK